jgi:undecaprenyl diphosphate synthase
MLKQILQWFNKEKKDSIHSIQSENIPEHIAIIMDGNGRWAKRLGLPRAAGHHSGMKNVKKIAIAANNIGVKVLTLYAFSTENWKRPKEEIDYLMKLPEEFFVKEIDHLMKENVKIRMMGYKENLPEHTLKPIENAIEKTKHNTGLILNFAMNYGSRKEMLDGFKNMVDDIHSGKLKTEDITENAYPQYLLSHSLPDPDLLIRTSGEFRISNFMLWQLAYTELWFTDVYWPDFKEHHLYSAIFEYQKRIRRYGGI